MNESLNLDIWDRLVQGKSLDGLPIGTKSGRIDLGGLDLPEVSVVRKFQFKGIPIAHKESGPVIQGAKWRNLDFTGSELSGLRLFDCEISNCRFDKCQLHDLRVWSTSFIECSFKEANLSESALGAVRNNARNVYSGVDFSKADMRKTIFKAAAFERCVFRYAKLVNIDFQTSAFVDCVFEGELRDVLFYRRGFEGEAFPPNEMVNVDFSRTKLRDVGFRGLTLDRVKLPQDSNHIIIRNVSATLDRLIVILREQGDQIAKQLTAFLNMERKWIAPNQVQAVINVDDLAETIGMDCVNRLRKLLS